METPVSMKTVGVASGLYSVVAAATDDDLSQMLGVQLRMCLKVLFLFSKKFYGLVFKFHYIYVERGHE
jgi:hypothetical protein